VATGKTGEATARRRQIAPGYLAQRIG
jgi:hypothetical protein